MADENVPWRVASGAGAHNGGVSSGVHPRGHRERAMSVRRQIYLAEDDAQVLEEESQRTGLSVSELVGRAVKQCYGKRRRLTWQEVFDSVSVKPNSAKTDGHAAAGVRRAECPPRQDDGPGSITEGHLGKH